MMANVIKNPDNRFVKNKLKRIKDNSGYCIDCPKVEEWRCPCKVFREMECGWCPEAVYYKKSKEEIENE